MLKWTVMARREAEKSDPPRRRSAISEITTTTRTETTATTTTTGARIEDGFTPRTKTKRRRSSTNRRRSSTSKPSNNLNRNSVDLKMDKENQFTSTPIKSYDHQCDVLRDVSNLTPNDPNTRRVLSTNKCKKNETTPVVQKKRKKPCLDPGHEQSNYFRPFETVDSHIKGLSPDNIAENRDHGAKRRIEDVYAPTLPRFGIEYSPGLITFNSSPLKQTPLGQLLNLNGDKAVKRQKIEHVNDFIQQISTVQSPEIDHKAAFEVKSNYENIDEIKVTPLVKKFVDLQFSQISLNDSSSLINDLSLEKIVDAILDSTVRSDKQGDCNLSNAINLDIQEDSQLNTTQLDSGFKSTTIEYSHHQLEGNFVCQQCKPKISTLSSSETNRTIININETFNERCVDVTVKSKKRSLSLSPVSITTTTEDDGTNFTLKRQRCIRRRRTDDDRKIRSSQKKSQHGSFNLTAISGQIADYNKSTPKKISSDCKETLPTIIDRTFTLTTPVDTNRRFRRCLQFESPTSLSESASATNCSIREVRGSIDLNIRCNEENVLYVNIIRCRDLYRPNGKQINAYVKVAFSDRRKRNGLLQRTPVLSNSEKPLFNHTFKFPIDMENSDKRIHIEVWHRDRKTRTSEFLGCLSFDVRHAFKKEISGSYRLLPQSTGRSQNIPITPLNQLINNKTPIDYYQSTTTMCESQSSVDEIVNIDDLDNDLKKTTSKAILNEQQKYADENLFLRYLELDPMEGPEAIPAAMQRKATGNKNGRTPFTQTKRLQRPPKSGFGFSVVWTHPPRIERVEKGLPADKAGILPGDYIIFVDKHNVVMMPEIDILNLIRSYGNQLTLEIFRRNTSRNGSVPSVRRLNSTGTCSTTGLPITNTNLVQRRPSTVCSTNTTSVDYNRKKLHLPQVTFTAEKPTNNPDENRRKAMYQLISKEQQYATGLQFAVTRFVSALAERRDLITPMEHKALFQNSEEILRITDDILEAIVQDDGEPQLYQLCRTYHGKLTEIVTAYKKYCSGIKKADCVLANKTKNSNSEFVRFLYTPSIPRRRPDITAFIHKPLEHYREILRLLTIIQANTKSNHEDFPVINQVVQSLQQTYREITVDAGLMEPMGEGRPLLTVQDVENRLVFTKCKPFVLNKPGRQWIFGGDLGRVEGRNVRQYWTLLFSDLLLFAKVSRDRVLFVIEDPLPLANISDMSFNIRKKDTEFRIIVAPGGKNATSPTVHCGPDLSRTPKKGGSKRTVVLRAPTTELKAVWQILLQRQIFHVNAGMDGSAFSSPIESPDAPITSSVATLQSADSLSFRRQTPQNINENIEIQKQIDALIEHKCKQMSKTNSAKGNTTHLEKWMKSQLDNAVADEAELEPLSEEWTEEMLRKRSEELQLIDSQGNITCRMEMMKKTDNNRCQENNVMSDHDQSPSKSTTTESQITVRSSPIVPETVSVCRQCHRNCLSTGNNPSKSLMKNVNLQRNEDELNANDQNRDEDDWRPLFLMGLNAANPASSLVKLDPFSLPVPQISVAPPTPDNSTKPSTIDQQLAEDSCNCDINEMNNYNDIDASPDDSPQTEEHPYHSLSSSNLTLRRYGTVSSLERLGTEDNEDNWGENNNSSASDDEKETQGVDNEAFYYSSIRNWTAKAGSFVAEKMAFFERLGEDYRNSGRLFDRYLKTSDIVNGDEGQEEETSGATSGEEIWGTPTSGGEMDDAFNSPNYEGNKSPYDGSISSDNGDDTELMMDELLMTPPISASIMRGLLPRRTLEPLIEEDCSESCSSSPSVTEQSISPAEQGNETGNAADICSTVAESHTKTPPTIQNRQEMAQVPSVMVTTTTSSSISKIHRSDSYRRIVEAAEEAVAIDEDHLSFFDRFKPTAKFVNIERVPRSKSVRIFEFFNMRRERRIHQSIPEGRQLIKLFSKEDAISDSVPTSYSDKPLSPRRLKDKQLDRRFWKQLSKRRGNKMATMPA